MREAGDVCYTDVLRDGTGIVEYGRYEDMKYALRKLDDTKFKSHEVYVHLFLAYIFIVFHYRIIFRLSYINDKRVFRVKLLTSE